MMFRKNILSASAITLSIMGFAGHLSARENVVTSGHKSQLKTSAAAGCQPATAAIDLDINNLSARLMTGGDMWWNIGEGVAAYEIPKGSGKSSQFAASCWIGGYDQQGQLKVAAQTYRQDGNDYWPGALDANAKITSDVCTAWDYQWKVDKSTINAFIALTKSGGNTSDAAYDVIFNWPATGNARAKGFNNVTLNLYANNSYAPFVDLNSNGIYEPNLGEYPDITGDEYIWWVFNDAGNVKQQSLTAAIGVEVQTSAFAYATQDFLNNASFYNYRVINRGTLTIDSTYIAVWDDCDLGYYLDDFIGCDTTRGLGIQYNGTNCDGCAAGNPVNSYGQNPPQVGLDYFQGPKKIIKRSGGLADTFQVLNMTNFTYYNNDFSNIGNPSNGVQIYNYMTGSIRTGQRFSDDFQGPGIPSKGYGSGPVSNFVFWGDPSDNTQWSECACNNNPNDRRFIFSAGPFQLLPGALNDVTFGCIWAAGVGGCPSTSFTTIKSIDDQAQALFENHFKTVEGPNAPRMMVRELDRKLVFYLVNDYGSNNFGENYGRTDGVYNDSLQYHQIVVKALGANTSDTLYKFEGYRIFQLANSSVATADIFDPTTGQVDPTKAAEVKTFDIKDSVLQIVNYVQNVNIAGSPSVPQIKVTGTDNGISHSFELTEDQFATGPDKQFINYQTYYFVAIAYAYNNFAPFSPANFISTQDAPYIGSAHGAGGIAVPLVIAMPNPTNGAVGTIVNAAYGQGVMVTRIEGVGNGGNTVELDSASEVKALAAGSVDSATYVAGSGPINVKVVDPTLIPNYSWVLQVKGKNTTDSGITTQGLWVLTAFDKKGNAVDTIYSEENIASLNEQVLEKYGLSVSLQQVLAPGIDQKDGNGYITSDITFTDPSQPWLWGVQDQSDSSFANWLRSGNNQIYANPASNPLTDPCNFNDYTKLDTNNFYENLLSNFSPTKSTWGPYDLAAAWAFPYHASGGSGSQCGFAVAYSEATQGSSSNPASFEKLNDVDIVFTADKSLWTRCAVVEEQESPSNAQGGAPKFTLRNHAGWDLQYTTGSDGREYPTYSEIDSEQGMSWFPGYAIDEGTGQRLNIVFGEDSYLGFDNGQDMIWNPSSRVFDSSDGSIIFGGKHFIYVLGSAYDQDQAFVANVKKYLATNLVTNLRNAYSVVQWVGVPTVNPTVPFTTISKGLIPTTTRLRFRVNRPYMPYFAADTAGLVGVVPGSETNPYYTFTTSTLAPSVLNDTSNRNAIMSNIMAVPNPYYGFSGYESSRLDTRVRITNLPAQVTVNIYSLDGSLVRVLSKNDPNTPYIDWDIRNTAGLPVASGMYLMDVKAPGIGETVIKWFGAQRPIDVSTY